jgi:palmitoyl transferase
MARDDGEGGRRVSWRALLALAVLLPVAQARAQAEATVDAGLDAWWQRPVLCDFTVSWLQQKCLDIQQTYRHPDERNLYITGHAHHGRRTYTREKLDQLNEDALGGGLGRGRIDAEGDFHGVYAMVFLDSHRKAQWMLGYAYQNRLALNEHWSLGGGYTGFIVSRPDVYRGVPVPAIFPLVSVQYRQTALMAAYVPHVSPDSTGNGDVTFLFLRTTY